MITDEARKDFYKLLEQYGYAVPESTTQQEPSTELPVEVEVPPKPVSETQALADMASQDPSYKLGEKLYDFGSDSYNAFMSGVNTGIANQVDAGQFMLPNVNATEATKKSLMETASGWDKKSREYYSKTKNPNGLWNQSLNALGSTIPGMGTSLALTALGGAGALALGHRFPNATKALTTSLALTQGVNEAAGNAGRTYRKNLAKGVSPEEAQRTSNIQFSVEAPVNYALEKAGVLGDWVDKIKTSPIAKGMLATLAEGGTEGLQEILQDVIGEQANKNSKESYGAGVLNTVTGTAKQATDLEYMKKAAAEQGAPTVLSSLFSTAIGLGARKITNRPKMEPKSYGEIPGSTTPETENTQDFSEGNKQKIDEALGTETEQFGTAIDGRTPRKNRFSLSGIPSREDRMAYTFLDDNGELWPATPSQQPMAEQQPVPEQQPITTQEETPLPEATPSFRRDNPFSLENISSRNKEILQNLNREPQQTQQIDNQTEGTSRPESATSETISQPETFRDLATMAMQGYSSLSPQINDQGPTLQGGGLFESEMNKYRQELEAEQQAKAQAEQMKIEQERQAQAEQAKKARQWKRDHLFLNEDMTVNVEKLMKAAKSLTKDLEKSNNVEEISDPQTPQDNIKNADALLKKVKADTSLSKKLNTALSYLDGSALDDLELSPDQKTAIMEKVKRDIVDYMVSGGKIPEVLQNAIEENGLMPQKIGNEEIQALTDRLANRTTSRENLTERLRAEVSDNVKNKGTLNTAVKSALSKIKTAEKKAKSAIIYFEQAKQPEVADVIEDWLGRYNEEYTTHVIERTALRNSMAPSEELNAKLDGLSTAWKAREKEFFAELDYIVETNGGNKKIINRKNNVFVDPDAQFMIYKKKNQPMIGFPSDDRNNTQYMIYKKEQKKIINEESKAEKEGDAKALSPVDVIELIRGIVPVRHGMNFLRDNNALAQYKPTEKVIRTRFWNQLKAILHEYGHAWEDRLHFLGEDFVKATPLIKEELMAMGQETLSNRRVLDALSGDRKALGELYGEGISEYMRMRAYNEKYARDFAPEYSKVFDAMLEEEPKFKKAFEAVSNAVRQYESQDVSQRLDAAISSYKDKKKWSLKNFITKVKDMAVFEFEDSQHIWDVVGDTLIERIHARIDEINALAKENRATKRDLAEKASLESMLVKDKDGKEYLSDQFDLSSAAHNLPGYEEKAKQDVGKYKDILSGMNLEEAEELSKYVVAKNAISYFDNGMEPGLDASRQELEDFCNKVPQKIKDKADEIRNFYDDFMERTLLKSGVLSREQLDAMRAKWPFYFPMARDKRDIGENATFKGKGSQIIINPAQPVKKRTGLGSILEPMVDKDGLPMFDENGDMLMQKRADPRAEGAFLKVYNPLETIMGNIVSYHGLAARNEVGRMMMEIARIPGMGWMASPITGAEKISENQFYIWDNGKKVNIATDKDIHKALMEMMPAERNLFRKVFSIPAKLLTVGATVGRAAWPFINIFNDAFTTALFTNRAIPIPFYNTIEGLWILSKAKYMNDPEAKTFIQETVDRGLWLSGFVDAESIPKSLKAQADLVRNALKADSAFSKFKHWWDANFAALSEATEVAPKISEYKYLVEKKGVPKNQAIRMARGINIDHNMKGRFGRVMNDYVPFTATNLQLLAKMARHAGFEGDLSKMGRFWSRLVMFAVLPTVLSELRNGDDDKFKDMPDYKKNNNYVIKVGDGFVTLPNGGGPIAAVSSLTRSALRYMRQQDPDAFNDMADVFLDLLPNGNPALISPFMDIRANKASFTGFPIVPRRLTGLKPEDQYTRNTTNLAKTLGKAFGVSPLAVDYVIRGWGGAVGSNLAGIDKTISDLGNTFNMTETKGGNEKKNFTEYSGWNRFYSEQGGQTEERLWSTFDAYDKEYKSMQLHMKTDKAKPDGEIIRKHAVLKSGVDRLKYLDKILSQTLDSKTLTPTKKRMKADRIREQKRKVADITMKRYAKMSFKQ